ncbi:MAG: MFS transporter [Hyphomicrobiaceae bacterium]
MQETKSGAEGKASRKGGTFTPLKHGVFRNMWAASVFSNLGLFILGVGAAWDMTKMSGSASMVALVQTAMMLPVALFSLAAGAIADMFDRRKVAMAALTISISGSSLLTILAHTGHISPYSMLLLCFIVGSGTALLWPTWGAAVSEQVPPDVLPAAVALNGISYNTARSLGPAIGGVIVAAAGGVAAFGTAALFFIPLLIVLFLWKRVSTPTRLPPERLGRALITGIRYVSNSPSIRVVIGRTLIAGLAGGSVAALLPLVSRDLLHGGAQLFGFLLGAFGVGSILGALNFGKLRMRYSGEAALRLCTLGMGAAVVVISLSPTAFLTIPALVLFGTSWTGCMMCCNVSVQLSAPRWVAARSLAAYQASVSAGVGFGGWGWGVLANDVGVGHALLASACVLIVSPILGRWMRMPTVADQTAVAGTELTDPEIRVPLLARSGPIVIEIEYRVEIRKARLFHAVMQRVRSSRTRNGAYGWSIARDLEDPEIWIERYHCPTWHDYLRQRNRPTVAERELHARALKFHQGPEPVRIHRMLERPGGQVHWRDGLEDQGKLGPNGVITPPNTP